MSSLHCWACGSLNDDGTCLSTPGATPSDGDIGICLYCRAVLMFTGDGWQHRAPTPAELDDIERDNRVPQVMRLATRVALGLGQ